MERVPLKDFKDLMALVLKYGSNVTLNWNADRFNPKGTIERESTDLPGTYAVRISDSELCTQVSPEQMYWDLEEPLQRENFDRFRNRVRELGDLAMSYYVQSIC